MNFCSDNVSGIHPRILDALIAGNDGDVMPYGEDPHTRRAEARFCEIFERELAVAMMATGTGANALALSLVASPISAIFCRSGAHLLNNEAGAPLMYTNGARIIGIDGRKGLIDPGDLERALADFDPTHLLCKPAVVSVTQASELGTVYSLQHLGEISAVCRRHGVRMHMDGARFANALVHLGCQPAEMSWRAGVDVLSFGATKGGALAAEAVVFFDAARGANMAERRKRGGHLVSKHRFIAAQIEAYLAGDLWLKLARHANAMADRLAAGLAAAGLHPVWPVEANEVFAALPLTVDTRLKAAGASYYPWTTDALPDGLMPARDAILVRLVTSFVTPADEVDRFVAVARAS